MRCHSRGTRPSPAALLAAILLAAPCAHAVARTIPSGGTIHLPAASAPGRHVTRMPHDAKHDPERTSGGTVNRTRPHPHVHAKGAAFAASQRASSNPELMTGFDGLLGVQQTFANGGNQLSTEPPDQGLCVGNGFVLETVNTVLRVFDTNGAPLTDPIDLNTFYGYPPEIDADTGAQGPSITDPSCLFDPDTQRWFHVVLTLAQTPDGKPTGPNYLDLAVSKTADPRGAWTLYHLPVTDDGSEGTSDHGCRPDADVDTSVATNPNACLGDFPHLGADDHGFYVTTNEFPFFSSGFHGAQVYAFSKRALARGDAQVTVTQFDTATAVDGEPGFTLIPALSPAGDASTAAGGTEYLLSSDSGPTGVSRALLVWAITNSASLDSASPAPALVHTKLQDRIYADPAPVPQAKGPVPLVQCLNDRRLVPPLFADEGNGCWRVFFTPEEGPPRKTRPSRVDAIDSRMTQTAFAGGHLWGALTTALSPAGKRTTAGILWYDVVPTATSGAVSAVVNQSGYVGLEDTALIVPAIGMLSADRGAMSFTILGKHEYPSAGYAVIGPNGPGPIHVAGVGLGPVDGFTGLHAFGGENVGRWGDYSAAAVERDSVWLASEYIAQTCTLAEYLTDSPGSPVGTCGFTRDFELNWATRISRVIP